MGMYTGVRCKVIIKEEYREDLNRIFTEGLYWSDSNIGFISEYGSYSRADFIPRGCLCYMPDEWEDKNENATEGFDRKFNLGAGYWSFQCSLKDYDDTIQTFFDNVLSKIVKSIVHLEVFYEENDYSKSYKLEDEKIVEDNYRFIKYGY